MYIPYCGPSGVSDTSSHLSRKLQRDLQYVDEGPSYIEKQTCSSIVTHPDPCHHCWPGRKAKPSEPLLATLSRRSESEPKYECQTGELGPCRRCGNPDCKHKHHCQGSRLSLLFEDFDQPGRVSNRSQFSTSRRQDGDKGDDNGFGPWSDRPLGHGRVSKDTSDEAWSNIFTSYIPAQQSESLPPSTRPGRTSLLDDGRHSLEPWPGLPRQRAGHMLDRPSSGTNNSRLSSLVGRNSWTYRDRDNLRFPVVSSVVRSLNKSEAHAR